MGDQGEGKEEVSLQVSVFSNETNLFLSMAF